MTGTERKTINKYYPPDFDPRKIPKGRFEPNRQYVIRVMAPFNMRCNSCAEYIYKGKKFNARRETVQDDDYLGLSLFRFYIRCPGCLAEITFKTDLKNCDYSQEHGATRLFEAEKLLREEQAKTQKQLDDDKTNPMKMLEVRTKMSRFEMESLERLEELREMNQRQLKPEHDKLIDNILLDKQELLRRQEQEDEEFVNTVFGKTSDGKIIKRLLDDDDDDEKPGVSNLCNTAKSNPVHQKEIKRLKIGSAVDQKSILKSIIINKKTIDTKTIPNTTKKDDCNQHEKSDERPTSTSETNVNNKALKSLCDYGPASSSNSEDDHE